MALSYPLDFLLTWPGWTPKFDLLWRQEQSRQSNGVTRVKDFGEPLWQLTASTRNLSRRELDIWRAKLHSLENGIKTFKGRPLSRCYPIAYPNGSWPTGTSFDGISATVYSIGANNTSLAIDLLPAAYTFSAGDMISIAYSTGTKFALHQVMEPSTASGTGVTAEFEVRPHLPVGLAINDVVSVKNPYCLMTLVPGSVVSESGDSGRGRVSFSAVEYR